MRKAIILHGSPYKEQFFDPNFPSSSNYYWLPWLQKQLVLNDIPANTPEVPNAWIPHYPTWKNAFEVYDLDEEIILVGHSCGAGFLIRWLSENKDVRVGKVILVAPWLDPTFDPGNADSSDFFNFVIDPELVSRTKKLIIISSDNDMETIQKSVKKLRDEIPGIQYKELHDRKHFYDDNNMEFPELLEEILR